MTSIFSFPFEQATIDDSPNNTAHDAANFFTFMPSYSIWPLNFSTKILSLNLDNFSPFYLRKHYIQILYKNQHFHHYFYIEHKKNIFENKTNPLHK